MANERRVTRIETISIPEHDETRFTAYWVNVTTGATGSSSATVANADITSATAAQDALTIADEDIDWTL